MSIHPARRTLCCQCTCCSMLIVDFGFLGHSTAMPKNWLNDWMTYCPLSFCSFSGAYSRESKLPLKATPSTPSNNKGWIRPSQRKLVVSLNISWLNRIIVGAGIALGGVARIPVVYRSGLECHNVSKVHEIPDVLPIPHPLNCWGQWLREQRLQKPASLIASDGFFLKIALQIQSCDIVWRMPIQTEIIDTAECRTCDKVNV